MDFLTQTYLETGNIDNWFPTRFESSRNEYPGNTFVWEDLNTGSIVAVANPESNIIYVLQIHPDYEYLTTEMARMVEKNFRKNRPKSETTDKFAIVLVEGNRAREKGLKEAGFKKGHVCGFIRFRDVNAPIPDEPTPTGYRIRTITDEDDENYVTIIQDIFGHGESFDVDYVQYLKCSSFYKSDLDLVAVDEKDNFASVCTFRFDPASRVTELEPMGTHPAHRGKGLAKALLTEGFRRLQKYNPSLLFIGGAANNPGANRLYDVTGFVEKKALVLWVKEV